jgi:hypothetical protein
MPYSYRNISKEYKTYSIAIIITQVIHPKREYEGCTCPEHTNSLIDKKVTLTAYNTRYLLFLCTHSTQLKISKFRVLISNYVTYF